MAYSKLCLFILTLFMNLSCLTASAQQYVPTLKPTQFIGGNPDTNILHEILAQETDLRIELQRSVQSLLKDVATLKTDRDQLTQRVSDLEGQNAHLKQLYSNLKNDFESLNISCCSQRPNPEFTNISSSMNILKKQYRYLSLSLMDIHSKADEINTTISRTVNDNFRNLSDHISTEINHVNQDLVKSNQTQAKFSSDLKTIQQSLSSSLSTIDRKYSDAVANVEHNMSSLVSTVDKKLSSSVSTIDRKYSDAVANVEHNMSSLVSTVDKKLTSSIADLKVIRAHDHEQVNISISNIRTSLLRTEHEQAKISSAQVTLQQKQAQISSAQVTLQQKQAQISSTQATLQQKQAQISSTQATLSSDLSALQNNYTNIIKSRKSQISFNAGLSSSKTSLSSGETIIYQHAISNIGNAYNAATGIFTSPQEGTFVFYFSTYPVYPDRVLYLDIVRNGNTVVRGRAYDKDNIDAASGLAVIHLTAGDRVWIRCYSGCSAGISSIIGSYTSTFSGFML